MTYYRSIIIVLFLLLPLSVQAGVRNFVAPLTASKWEVTSEKQQCHLTHVIPAYGKVVFSRYQGTGFSAKVLTGDEPRGSKMAFLRSVPPSWKGHEIKDLGEVHMSNNRVPFRFSHDITAQLLAELEDGMSPTLYYQDNKRSEHYTAVVISSVNFNVGYEKFHECISELLPFGFDDIRKSAVHFGVDSAMLSWPDKEKLDHIVKYMEIDQGVAKVNINGHTSNTGSDRRNRTLSKKRAEVVKKYLAGKGLPEEKLKTRGHSYRKPAASNKSARGRALNRRTEIGLVK